jgi:hypothetical protein
MEEGFEVGQVLNGLDASSSSHRDGKLQTQETETTCKDTKYVKSRQSNGSLNLSLTLQKYLIHLFIVSLADAPEFIIKSNPFIKNIILTYMLNTAFSFSPLPIPNARTQFWVRQRARTH